VGVLGAAGRPLGAAPSTLIWGGSDEPQAHPNLPSIISLADHSYSRAEFRCWRY